MAKRKLLIVDDSPDILEIFGIELRNRGYQVEVATDGKEAILKTEKFKPDIVVTDLKMPDIDGFEFIKKIKGQEQFKTVPLIAISGKTSSDMIVKLEKIGVDGFLEKPVNFEHLTAKIENLLRKSRSVHTKSEILFAGMLDEMSFLEVAQLFHQSRKSGILVIENDNQQIAELVFEDGKINYSSCEPYFGLAAFHHIVRIETGKFKLIQNGKHHLKNIWIAPDKLIMKAATEYDEFEVEEINNQLFLPVSRDFWIQGRRLLTDLLNDIPGINNIVVFEKSGRIIITLDNEMGKAIETASIYLNLTRICLESDFADSQAFFMLSSDKHHSIFFNLRANFILAIMMEKDTQLGVVLNRIQKKTDEISNLIGC